MNSPIIVYGIANIIKSINLNCLFLILCINLGIINREHISDVGLHRTALANSVYPIKLDIFLFLNNVRYNPKIMLVYAARDTTS